MTGAQREMNGLADRLRFAQLPTEEPPHRRLLGAGMRAQRHRQTFAHAQHGIA
jgi:hypothetical protein